MHLGETEIINNVKKKKKVSNENTNLYTHWFV